MDMVLLSDRSKVFDLADPYVVSAYVNQHVGSHAISVSDSQSQAMLVHRQMAGLDFCRIRYGSETRVTSTALRDKYHVQIMISGRCIQRSAAKHRTLLAGELMVINPRDSIDLTYSHDCEKFIVKIPVVLVEAVCVTQGWHYPSAGLQFEDRVYRLSELQGIALLLSLVCNDIENDEPIRTAQDSYVTLVILKLLTALITNVERSAADVENSLLGKVLRHVEDNLTQDVTPEALARHVNVSLRTLYGLFAKYLGEPPRRYCLKRRLESVRARLLRTEAAHASVTEVAMDYGFSHLGRFSAQYKALFSELPSETLKRSTLASVAAA